MKRNSLFVVVMMVLCVGLVGTVAAQPNAPNAPDAAVGTAFTYQGQIKRNGALFIGTCDMQFKLWDASSAGTQQGSTLNMNAVSVNDGVFTVGLDFGNQFKGDARWLETAAKCADDAGFTTLPRVALNPAPYALGLTPGAVISGTGSLGVMVNTPNGNAIVAYGKKDTYATIYGSDDSLNGGYAVYGVSTKGVGVFGNSGQSYGLRGESISSTGAGVIGVGKCVNVGGSCVGGSANAPGVVGLAEASGVGVQGISTGGAGVIGTSTAYVGVWGESTSFEGVRGTSHHKDHGGVVGVNDAAGGIAVYGVTPNGGFAGYFQGKVGIAGGSDLAELFDLSEQADPGTLMIIDAANPGHLTISRSAYDTKVAGIVSGAGNVRPGLTLHQEGVIDGDTEVAIAGRVYVRATAANGAIEPGDLLTTSDVSGHAMKATDSDRSHGAIIGKAMTGLKDGTGLVLVLVNLQ
jgi:hypothetical protein